MSIQRYRWIDLGIMAAILVALECVNSIALHLFPTEAFTLSIVLPVTLIVMMRWGAYGLLHAVLGGIVYCVCNGGSFSAYAVYGLGNLFAVLSLLLFKIHSKQAVRASTLLTLLFLLTGYLGMNIGRAAVAAIIEQHSFFDLLMQYLSVEALSAAIGGLVLLVARRQNGVFEDQKTYLLRLAEEGKQHA